MSSDLISIAVIDGEPRVDSRLVAAEIGVDHRKAREAPPFRAGRDRAARVACHVVAFRIITP